MMNINPVKETIKLYAKQLRTPTFTGFEEVARQLSPGDGYDKFLCELLKRELAQRQETSQLRRIKKAGFPVMKTLDEFDFSRLEHVSTGYLQELAACDYLRKRQNVVMIGNSGSGNYRKYLFMERFSENSRKYRMSLPKIFP